MLAAVLAPLLGTMLVAEELRSFSGLATVAQLVVFTTVLGATIVFYVQYRLTGSEASGWLTLCLAQYSVQGVALGGLRAAEPDMFFHRTGWVLLIDVPAALLILVCLRMSGHVRLRVDPLAPGLLLGLMVAAANLAANTWGTELVPSSPPVVAAQLALVLIGGGIAHAAYVLPDLPRWCSVRLGVGAIALVVNRVASAQDDTHVVISVLVVASGVAGAVLMVSAAWAYLRYSMQENQHSLVELSDQVATMEAAERDSRARLHEITNSIASIAVASTLLHQEGGVPEHTRRKLERMLESEAARLTRVLAGKGKDALYTSQTPTPTPAPTNGSHRTSVVDLDDVIGPLVTAQEALGRDVHWKPSGHRGLGDPDAVAEVVNILLDNSARHAPGSRPTIEVTQWGDTVEVSICDDGPGIPEEVRRHLFEWGRRGPDSHGQGIGLHLAHRLMSATGNSLRLEGNTAGNTFVIGLPAAKETP